MRFDDTLEFGRAGESVIASWLRQRGNTVLPAYEKLLDLEKGPVIFTPSERLIAPDFLSWKDEKCCWIEAKHKKAFSWDRTTSQFVTGIDQRNYTDYLKVEDKSPWPVWLLFLHDGGQAKDSPPSPSGLFGQRLSYLRCHIHHLCDKNGMVYWAEHSLILLTDSPLKRSPQVESIEQSEASAS